MGVKFNFYRGRNMESELLKLKNNYEFWDLFFKLDNKDVYKRQGYSHPDMKMLWDVI